MVTDPYASHWSKGVAVVSAAVALSLTACGATSGPDGGAANLEARTEARDTERALPPRVPAPEPIGEPATPPDALLQDVLVDAAQRTGGATDTVALHASWRVTWTDGSLGCPQPGMHYTQALVPGWRILVNTDAGVLDYRTGERSFFVCQPGKPQPVPDGQKKGPSEEGPPKL